MGRGAEDPRSGVFIFEDYVSLYVQDKSLFLDFLARLHMLLLPSKYHNCFSLKHW